MITINDLRFGYQLNSNIFEQFNLNIEAGGICGLLGKNGAGKTTLLNLLAGLLIPNAGTCRVLGDEPKLRHASLLEKIYYLPESLSIPALTIRQYIAFYAPFYPHYDFPLLEIGLKEFSLTKDSMLCQLSYGQKKKFFIAFGLATGAQLILLDEPTNGLDIPSKMQFRKLLAATINENKLIIISTHQVHDIENIIDSVLFLESGQNIFFQSIDSITKHLTFNYQVIQPDVNQALYYEKQLGGYTVINAKNDTKDSHIDLEVLFNGVLSNQNTIQQIFYRE
jgi:ABC-2 type transport system ATP-binding protein